MNWNARIRSIVDQGVGVGVRATCVRRAAETVACLVGSAGGASVGAGGWGVAVAIGAVVSVGVNVSVGVEVVVSVGVSVSVGVMVGVAENIPVRVGVGVKVIVAVRVAVGVSAPVPRVAAPTRNATQPRQ